MRALLVVSIVFVVAHAASLEEQWQEFKLNHGKTYKSLLEEKRRFAIFQDKVKQFEQHNAKFARGEVSYSVGINQFTDWTKEEIKAYLPPIKPISGMNVVGFHNTTTLELGDEPLNWVLKGYVTSVKNQLECNACWAFSAIGAIEGQVAKNGGALVSLSAQCLVDCSTKSDGCEGGYVLYSYDFVKENGIPTEEEYPYEALDDICGKTGGQKVSGYVEIDENEAAILDALKTIGPISVGIDAQELSTYKGGIFDISSGCTSNVTHAVLIVGAGNENGKDYWLVKNSWGEKWGQKGYFKLARGQNACGVNTMASYPTL